MTRSTWSSEAVSWSEDAGPRSSRDGYIDLVSLSEEAGPKGLQQLVSEAGGPKDPKGPNSLSDDAGPEEIPAAASSATSAVDPFDPELWQRLAEQVTCDWRQQQVPPPVATSSKHATSRYTALAGGPATSTEIETTVSRTEATFHHLRGTYATSTEVNTATARKVAAAPRKWGHQQALRPVHVLSVLAFFLALAKLLPNHQGGSHSRIPLRPMSELPSPERMLLLIACLESLLL